MKDKVLVERLTKGAVAIIGDVMLDHYVKGEVSRISPEAPVPVLQVTSERYVLGAAANVAANVAALGGKSCLIGVVGDDSLGRQLEDLLRAKPGVRAKLLANPMHPTIVKTRYVSGQQQIVRVDRENKVPLSPETTAALLAQINAAIADCSVIVLSDYGKGVLTDEVIAGAIAAARAAGKIVIVDPKRTTFEPYRGATYITPNVKELAEATQLPCLEDADAERAAARATEQSGAAILLTRSERGMSLFRAGEAPLHLSAQAREVFDVSGAGDTVVAALALALAAGHPVSEALRIANAAAGVVVGKLGTATASPEEVVASLQARDPRRDDAQLDIETTGLTPHDVARSVRTSWRRQGLRVGFANGCFDLIHPGHVSLLRQATAACDRLIVAINSDASVSVLKGPSVSGVSAPRRAGLDSCNRPIRLRWAAIARAAAPRSGCLARG